MPAFTERLCGQASSALVTLSSSKCDLRTKPGRGRVGSVAGAGLGAGLRQAGVKRRDLLGLVVSPVLGLGLATADRAWPVTGGAGLAAEVGRADEALRPRWVGWSGQTATQLAAGGGGLAPCRGST